MTESGTDSPNQPSPAEELFARYLARREAGGAPEIEELCRQHAAHAGELRRLHADWRRIEALLPKFRLGTPVEPAHSLAERLKGRYGSGVDPGISLEGKEREESAPATSELLRRLSEHGLKRSRYKLRGEIARGGMGAILKIWDEDLRRSLAMKVILGKDESPAEGGTPPVDKRHLARFLEEAQVTGQLDHPGIVPVHELGLDSEGRVYFTMKFVKGRDLKSIFDLVFHEREGWNETRALGVILKVCEAMAYAHAKGVIHRDLKPANVMVGSYGEVYVMDWGLARVLGREDQHDLRLRPESGDLTRVETERRVERETDPDSQLFTMDGDVVGTPAYMPPEQARGEIERLGPHSDVHAIGAILYHLLARQMPYAAPLERVNNLMVLRRVQEGPPRQLLELRRDVPAELVAICERAMAREPEKRYRDTLELAEDLRAYFEHRVVKAYRTGAIAELRKWVERNKGLAASLAAAVLLLAVGLSASLVFKARSDRNAILARENAEEAGRQTGIAQENERRAREQEGEAKKQAAIAGEQAALAQRQEALAREQLERTKIEQKKAEEAAAFLQSLFEGIDPYVAQGADTTLLSKILSGAEQRISTELGGLPEVEATIRQTLGEAYSNLGQYERAEQELRKAEALELRVFGEDDRRTLAARQSIGELLFRRGEHAAAEQFQRALLEQQERVLGPDDRDTLETKASLGDALRRQGRVDEAETILRSTLERQRELFGSQDEGVLRTMFLLAFDLNVQGEYGEAEELLGAVLYERSQHLGDDHPRTLEALGSLALVLLNEKKYVEAEEAEREALDSLSRTLGPENPQTLNILGELGSCLARQGRLEEAEAFYRQCLELRRKVLGPRHADTLDSLSVLAKHLLDQGRRAETIPLLEEALEGQHAVLGEDHLDTMDSKHRLAAVLKDEHRAAEAARLLEEIAEYARRTRGEDDPNFGIALYNWAGTLRDAEDWAAAERVFREVLGLREKHGWADEPFVAATINGLASALEARGDHGEADALFQEALRMRRDLFGGIELVYSLTDYGEALLKRGDYESAEPLLRELVELQPSVRRPGRWDIAYGEAMLGRCFARLGRFAGAEPLLRKGTEQLLNNPGAGAQVLEDVLDWIVELYESWEAAEPGHGHAAKAAEWRARRAVREAEE